MGRPKSKRKARGSASASEGESPTQGDSQIQRKKHSKLEQPKLDSFVENIAKMASGGENNTPELGKDPVSTDNTIIHAILDMQKTMERMFNKIEVLLSEKAAIKKKKN